MPTTLERINEKLLSLPATDIIDIESILDGYVAQSLIPQETLQAMDDVRSERVVKCTSLADLYKKLEI